MSEGALLARWEHLMRLVEAPYTDAVEQEKNRFIVEVSTTFASQQGILQQQFDHHAVAMLEIAQRYQARAIWLALKEALAQPVKAMGAMQRKEDWEKLWLYLVRSWVERYGAARAREAAGTTRKDIQRIIDGALAADGEFNPVRVASDILAARELSRARADVIARTEVHAAMMYSAEEGARKLSSDNLLILNKKWTPVLDERTRISHAAMTAATAVPLDQDFVVGGERMSRPGDPRASAANTIGCRCVLRFEVETG